MWQEERERLWKEIRKEVGRRAVEKVEGEGVGRWCAPEHERDAGVEWEDNLNLGIKHEDEKRD